ncbi:hypothetical protein E2C01_052461 [Portunus trituberculatus]|uniref:Uncharacterized protein n=1 Tax=Portunus trituberculatus TaxID=210409 RepID=A0A5B7GLL9_PORTR|nr:hypothetical protein [Portunus trituberculatus]
MHHSPAHPNSPAYTPHFPQLVTVKDSDELRSVVVMADMNGDDCYTGRDDTDGSAGDGDDDDDGDEDLGGVN